METLGTENSPEQNKNTTKSDPGATGAAAYDFEQTKPGKGAVTSRYYHTFNIPERFDNPDWFEGYSSKKQNPMYMTSSMEYGSHRPTVHTMPTSFHAKSQTFTEHLGTCGMYRNQSLNTAMDKSIV
ncbi:piercer of microtubule wall 1 protein-like isoform X4 [Oculina patagonica]